MLELVVDVEFVVVVSVVLVAVELVVVFVEVEVVLVVVVVVERHGCSLGVPKVAKRPAGHGAVVAVAPQLPASLRG